MPVTVKIPAPLRPLTANQGEVAVENAGTVQAVLEQLSRKYPGIREKLLDDKGALRRYVNLFRNDEDVRHAQGLGTELKALGPWLHLGGDASLEIAPRGGPVEGTRAAIDAIRQVLSK